MRSEAISERRASPKATPGLRRSRSEGRSPGAARNLRHKTLFAARHGRGAARGTEKAFHRRAELSATFKSVLMIHIGATKENKMTYLFNLIVLFEVRSLLLLYFIMKRNVWDTLQRSIALQVHLQEEIRQRWQRGLRDESGTKRARNIGFLL